MRYLPSFQAHPRAVLKVPTTPHSFKLLKTPKNRRELCQQTFSAIEYLDADLTIIGTTKESSITLLRSLAHHSESTLTRCRIAEIEAVDVRQKYAGKRAPRANRAKFSEARVVDNVEVGRLQKEDTAKEEKLRKAQAKATRAQSKANKAPQEGSGQDSGQSGQSGRSGRPPSEKVWFRN